MPDQNLLNFIKASLAQGKNKYEISAALISQGGWSQQDIDAAFAALGGAATVPPAPTPQPIVSSAQPLSAITVSPLAQAQPSQNKTSSHKRRWLLITSIVIIVFIVLGAGVAAAYYTGVFSFLTKPNPQTILAESLQAMQHVTSFKYQNVLTYQGTTSATQKNDGVPALAVVSVPAN